MLLGNAAYLKGDLKGAREALLTALMAYPAGGTAAERARIEGLLKRIR